MKPCRECGLSFAIVRLSQMFCSKRCRRRSSDREQGLIKAARARGEYVEPARVCTECYKPLEGMARQARRHKACTERVNSAKFRERHGPVSTKQVKAIRVKVRDPLRRTGRPRSPELKEIIDVGGDWFPGWNGCYSPNLSPFDIALIEKYFGPPGDAKNPYAARQPSQISSPSR